MLTAEEWTRDLKACGVGQNAITDNVLLRLKVIGRLSRAPRDDLNSKRVDEILSELEKYCAEMLDANPSLEPSLRGRLVDVGARCGKARRARGHWRQARGVFAPTGLGSTIFIKHTRAQDNLPTSSGNYWLERLDPKHRPWGHEGKKLFDDWYTSNTQKGFFDWLEDKGPDANLPQVEYLAPDQRWKYKLSFKSNKAWYPKNHGESKSQSTPELFSTKFMRSAHGDKVGFGVWVCRRPCGFYSASHMINRFHHSSFLAGGRVVAAGEWVFSNGELLLITHKTGHYHASPANLFSALQLLAYRLDLKDTVVEVKDYGANSETYVKAPDFLANHGNVAKCSAIDGAAALHMLQKASFLCVGNGTWKDLPTELPYDLNYAIHRRLSAA